MGERRGGNGDVCGDEGWGDKVVSEGGVWDWRDVVVVVLCLDEIGRKGWLSGRGGKGRGGRLGGGGFWKLI